MNHFSLMRVRSNKVSRRGVVCVLSLVLAIAGSQVAHALSYQWVTPDTSERAQMLASTGHAYLSYAAFALAVGTMLVLAALAVELGHVVRRRDTNAIPSALLFASLAPGIFVCQEHFERWFHDGVFPWDAALQPTFVVGVLLQLPFTAAAYVLARLLLHAVRSIGRLVSRPAVCRVLPSAMLQPAVRVVAPRVPVLALGYGSRGPPVLLR